MSRLLLLIAVLLSLTGCGQRESAASEPEPATTTPEATDATPTPLAPTPRATPAAASSPPTLAAPSATPPPGPATSTAEPVPTTAAAPVTLPTAMSSVPTLGPALTSEVPDDLVARISDDLVATEGLDRAALILVRGDAVTWSDGSLGCPRPGMAYPQVLTPGYWVVLGDGQRTYDYRATARGRFVRCADAPPPQPGVPPPGAVPGIDGAL